jgi:hypothetical protein
MELQQAESVDQLIFHLRTQPDKVATRLLTQFSAEGLLRLSSDEFDKQYVDGSDDGGIDLFHADDKRYFIFQTKFCEKPRNIAFPEILHELKKMKNALTAENPNKRAAELVASLRRDCRVPGASLEVVWVTSNYISDSTTKTVQEDLNG